MEMVTAKHYCKYWWFFWSLLQLFLKVVEQIRGCVHHKKIHETAAQPSLQRLRYFSSTKNGFKVGTKDWRNLFAARIPIGNTAKSNWNSSSPGRIRWTFFFSFLFFLAISSTRHTPKLASISFLLLLLFSPFFRKKKLFGGTRKKWNKSGRKSDHARKEWCADEAVARAKTAARASVHAPV